VTGLEETSGLSLAGRVAGAAKPSLAEAVREFEGYFVGEMLRSASRSLPGGGALDGGPGGRLYREMFFEQIGRLVARSGGFGLARSLGAPGGGTSGEGAAGGGES